MSRWNYTTTPNNKARFTLGQPDIFKQEAGVGPNSGKTLACFGINPSTAHPEKLDPTVTRVREFAKRNGYAGWMMLNIYPQRATDPCNIHLRRNSGLHRQNLEAIAGLLEEGHELELWAAWGIEIGRRPYLKGCLADIVEVVGVERSWIRMGALTKAGHPRHPLYLPYRAEFGVFGIGGYLLGG